MTKINKSASFAGTVEFRNGNKLDIHVGGNSNTGETIVWQQVHGRKASRVTGKNLPKFVAELNDALNSGEAVWLEGRNDAVIDTLKAFL